MHTAGCVQATAPCTLPELCSARLSIPDSCAGYRFPSLPYLVGLLGVGGKEPSIHSPESKLHPSYHTPYKDWGTPVVLPAVGLSAWVSGRPGYLCFLPRQHARHGSSLTDPRTERQPGCPRGAVRPGHHRIHLAQLRYQCCFSRLRSPPSTSFHSLISFLLLCFWFPLRCWREILGLSAGLGLKAAPHPRRMW